MCSPLHGAISPTRNDRQGPTTKGRTSALRGALLVPGRSSAHDLECRWMVKGLRASRISGRGNISIRDRIGSRENMPGFGEQGHLPEYGTIRDYN